MSIWELVVSTGSRDRTPAWHADEGGEHHPASVLHRSRMGGQSVSEPMQACIWLALFVDSRSRDRNTRYPTLRLLGDRRVGKHMPRHPSNAESDTHLHLPVGGGGGEM